MEKKKPGMVVHICYPSFTVIPVFLKLRQEDHGESEANGSKTLFENP